MTRIDAALTKAVVRAETGAPAQLANAIRYAVFPGGARIRPRLCIAVAEACGGRDAALAECAASALELLHCASLVHDDLPCFDDADTRRGRLSVHRMFGEPIAVLVGDALIISAFETIALGAAASPMLAPLLTTIACAAGSPHGLVAGQAWETEPSIQLDAYHRAKTGSLFIAATMCGAIVSGQDPRPWRRMGERLGHAYQVADDLLDALSSSEDAGKPTSQDALLSRPNAVATFGVSGAVARLREFVSEAAEAVPPCAGADGLKLLICELSERLVPAALKQTAA